MGRRFRVGQLDVQAADWDVFVVASPLRQLNPRDIADVLDGLASDGTDNRVALVPSRSSQHWTLDVAPGATAVQAELELAEEDFQGAVNAIGHWQSVPRIAAVQRGKVLCVHFDHGIGDAQVMAELVAAISHASPGAGFVEPRPTATTRHPFFWGLVNLAAKPKTLLSGIRATLASKTPRVGNTPDIRARNTTADPPSVVVVRSAPQFLSELGGYRVRAGVQASLAAIVMTSIGKSLRASGIDFGDSVEVVTDLRRYLPAGKTTLQNFTAVVRVGFDTDVTPDRFGLALAREVDSGVLLLKAAAFLVLLRVRSLWEHRRFPWRPASPPEPVPSSEHEPTVQRAMISFSDLTKLPISSKVAFASSDDLGFAVLLPMSSPAHVAIALCAVGDGEIHATATFNATIADPTTVRNALAAALNREALKAYI